MIFPEEFFAFDVIASHKREKNRIASADFPVLRKICVFGPANDFAAIAGDVDGPAHEAGAECHAGSEGGSADAPFLKRVSVFFKGFHSTKIKIPPAA